MKLLIIFMIIFLVSLIESQVILNRAQLAAWIPSYATESNITLPARNIGSIEASTFSLKDQGCHGIYLSFMESL